MRYAFMNWDESTRARGHESHGTHWRCVALLAGQVNWVCVERDELHGLDSTVIRNELHRRKHFSLQETIGGLPKPFVLLRVPCEERPGFPG